jgi:dipeptidyl aminopeptidase/acylaminoacyl peptidase
MERRPIFFHSEGEKLAGDLILPDGEGPFPAVLFIAGTGSQTRYADIFMGGRWHRAGSYRLFSDRLAEAGIASLCWDKRGVSESTGGDRAPGDPPGDRDAHANVLTDVADAKAALGFLSDQREIDSRRMAVWGKSAGVYFASLLAARTDLPAAYVFVGGLYRSLPDLCEYVFEWINGYMARNPEAEAWIKEDAPYNYAYAKHWRGYVEAAESGEADVYEPEEGTRFYLTRLRYELAHPPAEQFRHVQKPTLVLHGDRDVNVPVEDCYEVVRALNEAGNRDVTLVVVPGADHGLRISPTDDDWETRKLARVRRETDEHPVSEFFIRALTGWLVDRFSAVPSDRGPLT